MEPRKYQFNNSTLTIVFGDIMKSESEVIVSSDDTGISMGGGISGCILKAGGEAIRQDAQKKLPAQLGDVVVSTAGMLEHQKFIFHCLTIDHEHKSEVYEGRLSNTEDINNYILQHSVDKCFRLMQALDLNSIAFPCIGAGLAHISLKKMAEVLIDTVSTFLYDKTEQYNIELYIHNKSINADLTYLGFTTYFEGILKKEKRLHEICNEDFYDDTIYLTIDGTSYENVKVILSDPCLSLRDQIKRFIQVFNLPKLDNGCNPVQYLFGIQRYWEDEPDILDFEDEDGHEQCMLDYNIQSGDHLHLISVPIAGGSVSMALTCYPKRKNIIQRLFSGKSNRVYSSVFAPDTIRKGSGMMVQVYLYKDEEHDEVCYDATKCDKLTKECVYSPLNFKLERGAFIDVNIRVSGIEIERPHKKIVWEGIYTSAKFYVEIPENYSKDQVWGEVFLSVDGALLGELDFLTKLTTKEPDRLETAHVISRQYKKIFISYAHQDESKVQYIARAYDAQGVDYFFDRHYLKPGDIFPQKIKEYIDSADLFILCWSANAAQSEYVELERKQALERALPKNVSNNKVSLSIYPMSIDPHAELPIDMKDIYNFIEIREKKYPNMNNVGEKGEIYI